MKILFNPNYKTKTGVYQDIRPENIGWKWLSFQARGMKNKEFFEWQTLQNELVIVLLGGNFKLSSDKGTWETINGRQDVFSGMPHTLYLPSNTSFKLTATSNTLHIAYAWSPSTDNFNPKLINPDETPSIIFGGDNATRQFNDIIPEGFPCSKIVAREVYTPSGNWSSYPAHKHDKRKIDKQGNLIEPEQVEIYFYQFQKHEAYAIQQVYTKEEDKPSKKINEIVKARHGDVVTIPYGYHPVVASHGFHCYYLNFLSGTDQSLKNSTDIDHEWIFSSWHSKDSRLPLVTKKMNLT